jgi:stearoyl-CoA desaturase (delta-9 desaturase)
MTVVMPERASRSSPAPLNLTTLAVMAALHAGGVVGLVLVVTGRVAWPTALVAAVLWIGTGLSITAGYHRLFAHRSYRASAPVRWLFLVFGAAAFQNSALAWSADHRDHHAHADGPGDPYSITQGFWWAHMGWLFRSREGSAAPEQRLVDLARYRSVVLQHRWYAVLAIVVGLALPVGVCSLWGDPWGGLFVAGALRAVVVLQATFCINSLAHFVGRRTYDRAATARDSMMTALITFGEGFHSFHHRFQADYRNGVRWWHYDPGKWLIWACEQVRLVSAVRRTARAAITAARSAPRT